MLLPRNVQSGHPMSMLAQGKIYITFGTGHFGIGQLTGRPTSVDSLFHPIIGRSLAVHSGMAGPCPADGQPGILNSLRASAVREDDGNRGAPIDRALQSGCPAMKLHD
jgi:hypothetical protein